MNDDELCNRLAQAFAPEPAKPPTEGIVAVRRAVLAAQPRPRPAWARHRLATGAAVFGIVAASSSAAFAVSGTPLPEPLRVVAHGLGLPVDSVAMAKTRTQVARLGAALKRADLASVRRDAQILQAQLAHLDSEEKAQIAPQADQLLDQANQAGAQGPDQQNQFGPNTPPPSNGTAGGPGTTAPTSDNHGQSPGSGSAVTNSGTNGAQTGSPNSSAPPTTEGINTGTQGSGTGGSPNGSNGTDQSSPPTNMGN